MSRDDLFRDINKWTKISVVLFLVSVGAAFTCMLLTVLLIDPTWMIPAVVMFLSALVYAWAWQLIQIMRETLTTQNGSDRIGTSKEDLDSAWGPGDDSP